MESEFTNEFIQNQLLETQNELKEMENRIQKRLERNSHLALEIDSTEERKDLFINILVNVIISVTIGTTLLFLFIEYL